MCGNKVSEKVRERFTAWFNTAGDTSLYSCLTCGAAVQPDWRETHDHWHRQLGQK